MRDGLGRRGLEHLVKQAAKGTLPPTVVGKKMCVSTWRVAGGHRLMRCVCRYIIRRLLEGACAALRERAAKTWFEDGSAEHAWMRKVGVPPPW